MFDKLHFFVPAEITVEVCAVVVRLAKVAGHWFVTSTCTRVEFEKFAVDGTVATAPFALRV